MNVILRSEATKNLAARKSFFAYPWEVGPIQIRPESKLKSLVTKHTPTKISCAFAFRVPGTSPELAFTAFP